VKLGDTLIDLGGGVSLARAWNTWSHDRPAEMTYLPLGVHLTPFAFAASTDRATLFPMARPMRLGAHTIDAATVDIELEHAKTRLALSYRKRDPFLISGSWRVKALGEWGARFWLGLALHADGGQEWQWDEASAVAWIRIGPRYVAVASTPRPPVLTGHDTVEEVPAELQDCGYSYLGSRGDTGRVLALRYSLEYAPVCNFVAAVGDDREALTTRVHTALAAAEQPAEADTAVPLHRGEKAGSLDAVRDTLGWNTIWDGINRRRYTGLSRNWSQRKFNGFGVWAIDVLYHALLSTMVDAELTRENLSAVYGSATPQGNVACRITGNDAWLDRSHPPIGSFVVWTAYLRLRERSLLETAFPVLSRSFDWWWRTRDPQGSGLVSYGSSNVGTGVNKGTKHAARNESSMDNSPLHDAFQFDPALHTLDGFDIGLNSLLALEAEMLSRIAGELGLTSEKQRLEAANARHRRRISEHLWDEQRNIFASRFHSGRFSSTIGPTSFYPLLAGVASAAQTQHLSAALRDETLFGGSAGLPSVARSDPTYHENVYWRGRIWPPLNFLVWHGLRRNGMDDDAARLGEISHDIFMRAWRTDGHVPENYNADTGEAMDQGDTDWFYSWGALMPALGVADLMDVNDWNGWEVRNGPDCSLGPVLTPAGRVTLEVAQGILALTRDEQVLLKTNIRGRIRRLQFSANAVSALLPASTTADQWIELPQHDPGAVGAAVLGHRPCGVESAERGARVTIADNGEQDRRFALVML
jgi:putative isomerase